MYTLQSVGHQSYVVSHPETLLAYFLNSCFSCVSQATSFDNSKSPSSSVIDCVVCCCIVHPFRRHSAFSDRCYRSVVCPSVCPSVTLVHPAKAVRPYEMPFSRDIRVVQVMCITQGPRSPRERKIWGRNC